MAFIGVNVIEVDGAGAPAIVGAATSVGAFNILTRRGVPNTPIRVDSFPKFVERFDANAFLYITKASDYYDLERQYGSGSAVNAFSHARAKFLVVSFTSDWLYPTYQSKAMVQAMKKNGLDVSFCEIEAKWGHDAFLLPNERLTALMKGFLERVHRETQE